MSKNRAPGFMFYPEKAVAGSAHLTPPAFKAYWLVLCHLWAHTPSQYSMPDTESAWRRATHNQFTPEALRAARAEIQDPEAPLFALRAGRAKSQKSIVSKGLRKEAEKQRRTSAARVEAAKARWNKGKGEKGLDSNCNANAPILQPLSIPIPIPIPAIQKKSIAAAGRAGKGLTKEEKKRARVEVNTDDMKRLGSWFGRKASTRWTLAEAEALAQLQPLDGDEVETLNDYYTAQIDKADDMRRRSVETLLNNWPGEVDRARKLGPELNKTKTARQLRHADAEAEAAEAAKSNAVEILVPLALTAAGLNGEALAEQTRARGRYVANIAKARKKYGEDWVKDVESIVNWRQEKATK